MQNLAWIAGSRTRSLLAALLALGALVLVGAPPAIAIPEHTHFAYTGRQQEYKVPSGVALLGFLVQGGFGGEFNGWGRRPASIGGLVPSTPGQALYVEVGAEGTYGSTSTNFGGGGPGGTPSPGVGTGGPNLASSGGGASDLRTIALGEPGSLSSRFAVAGGGGGQGGSGNSFTVFCVPHSGGGSADNEQPLPGGNAELGPVPIVLAGGVVVPGLFSGPSTGDRSRMTVNGFLDAGGGTDSGGLPGEGGSCTQGNATGFDSLPGFEGSEGLGGSGGNAATLPPNVTERCSGGNCQDAGAGGGGGGGYFGGGGGSTGYDDCTQTEGECGATTGGDGGGGGSSFFANEILFPYFVGSSVPPAFVTVTPEIEISSPASGANYAQGQVVDASWECTSENHPDNSPSLTGCKGTKAAGEAVDTSKGVHTFTVTGEPHGGSIKSHESVSGSITYTVLEAPTVTKVKPKAGPGGGGTPVTITGTNFEDVTAVRFGETAAAKYTVTSPTSITATSPAGASGIVAVTVTTGGGTSAVSKASRFKFAPTVTGVSPAAGPVAGGTRVTITGTGFSTTPGVTRFKFEKAKALEVECSSSSTCTATAPAHAAGAVDVKASVNKASSAKSAGDLFSYS